MKKPMMWAIALPIALILTGISFWFWAGLHDPPTSIAPNHDEPVDRAVTGPWWAFAILYFLWACGGILVLGGFVTLICSCGGGGGSTAPFHAAAMHQRHRQGKELEEMNEKIDDFSDGGGFG